MVDSCNSEITSFDFSSRQVAGEVDDNTNVESKTRSVVMYVINNIISTALTVPREDSYILEFCA